VSILFPLCHSLIGRRRKRETAAAPSGIRWQLLRALRALSLGAVLVVQADPELPEKRVVVFEEQFLPQLVGGALLQRDWVRPSRPHWIANSMFYQLSPTGLEALESGLNWWKSLPIHRRLLLRLIE
jgi:hypothetical protein